jgi:hypothetical protein
VASQLAHADTASKNRIDVTLKRLRNTTVDFIFKDASDQNDKMPLDTMDVDKMKMNGTYFDGQKFTDGKSFVSFIKSNRVFGSELARDYYLYTISRPFSAKLKPSGYHMRNFPAQNSMVAICKSKFLVISPYPKSKVEKKGSFSAITVNGDNS